LACDKIEVKEEGEAEGRQFHRFKCVLGECNDCPTWTSIIPKVERECTIPIRYSVYSGYHTCSHPQHKEHYIAIGEKNKRYCTKCDEMSEEDFDKFTKKANCSIEIYTYEEVGADD